ncbi:hypothetical protein QR685DRAFT_593057 [Neurospora intermedia]|uniref:Uncharacterized protein n=1 Tax=Neurospora intermedia TaxID=5142 RepID=A0ABR3DNI7_NEUIN
MPSKRRTRLKILTATYGRDIYYVVLRWGRKARLTLPDGLIRWKITENEIASGKTQIRLYTVTLKPKNSTGLPQGTTVCERVVGGITRVRVGSAAGARSCPVEHFMAARLPELYTFLDSMVRCFQWA